MTTGFVTDTLCHSAEIPQAPLQPSKFMSPEAATQQERTAAELEVPWPEEADPDICWLPFSKGVIFIRSSSARMLGLHVNPDQMKGYNFRLEGLVPTNGEPHELVAQFRLSRVKPGSSRAQQSDGLGLQSGAGSAMLLRALTVDPKKRGRLQVRRGHDHVKVLRAENISCEDATNLTSSDKAKRPLQQEGSGGQPAKAPKQTHTPTQRQQQAAVGSTAGGMLGSIRCSVAERSEQVRHRNTLQRHVRRAPA